MKTFSLLFLIIFMMAACSQKKNDQKKPGSVAALNIPSDTSALRDSAENPVSTKLYKGFYIYGDEINTFRDCSNKQVYWVEDENNLLRSAYKKERGNLSYPYESMYVELKGYLKGKSDIGYASEYENVLKVTSLKSATQKSFLTDCYDFEFIAVGNEPFWSLEIIPAESIVAFKDVAAGKVFVFPYQKPHISANTYAYNLNNEKGDHIRVTISKENCNDGMSDRNYQYSSQISLNSKMFDGCAIRKGDKL